MQARVSTKGQIVLPGPLRRRLGISEGDSLAIRVETGSIILTPCIKRSSRPKIATDPITGLPALIGDEDSPVLTSREVEEILANFP